MIESDKEYLIGVGVGLIIGMLLVWLILADIDYGKSRELGQSICDQEYNLDFDSYDGGNLKCKPKQITKVASYDGIIIHIKEE